MDRGPGWPTVLALTLVVLTFSVIHPLQLLLVPMGVLLVALPPRRPRMMVFAALLLAAAFLGPQGPMWAMERGWALVLSAWFVLAVLVWPDRAFLPRALGATVATVATAAVVIAAFGSWGELDWAIASQYRELASTLAASWPGGIGADVVDLAAQVQARLFPGFLAVGSLAALAVAWWAYTRLGRGGRMLGRLTEFRFPDGLLWLLIVGLALLLVPLDGWGVRVGSNVLFFMSALYVLRGLAVLAALVLGMGAKLPVLIALSVVGLLLYPIVVAGTLLLGVTDTWLDLRSGHVTNEEG